MFNLNSLTPTYAFESLSFGTDVDKSSGGTSLPDEDLYRMTNLMQKLTADVS